MLAPLAALILAGQTPPLPPPAPPPSPHVQRLTGQEPPGVEAIIAAADSAVDGADAVIDRLHEAAAQADGAAYFALFAPNARFIGTDASEHWDLAAFRAYAEPIFARGQGWTYRSRDRSLTVEGDYAWFDETLEHDSYGALRGSGVLKRNRAGQWKIEQYVLSFTVPNDKAEAVVDLIQAPAAD